MSSSQKGQAQFDWSFSLNAKSKFNSNTKYNV